MTELRVTSVWRYSKLKTIFAGVPLTDDRAVKSARQIIVVHSPTRDMPVEPKKGQCWKVEGNA